MIPGLTILVNQSIYMTETTRVCGHSNTDTTSFTKDVVETYTQTEKNKSC